MKALILFVMVAAQLGLDLARAENSIQVVRQKLEALAQSKQKSDGFVRLESFEGVGGKKVGFAQYGTAKGPKGNN